MTTLSRADKDRRENESASVAESTPLVGAFASDRSAGSLSVAFRFGVLASIAAALVLAFLYFGPIFCMLLLALAILTYTRPEWGVSLLFLTVSVDTARPIFGWIYVSLSEMELAICLLSWLVSSRRTKLNLEPVGWAVPFLVSVFLSGLVNTTWYKVLPHLLRASELFLALFIASNAIRSARAQSRFSWFLLAAGVIFPIHGFLGMGSAPEGRIFSFFSNPNQFGPYLSMLLAFFAALFFWNAGKRRRLFFLYAAVFALAALGATRSRAAMAGCAVSLVGLWLLYYAPKLRRLVASPVSLTLSFLRRSGPVIAVHVLAALLFAVFLWGRIGLGPIANRAIEDIRSRTSGGVVQAVVDFRRPYYWAAVQMWRTHPFLGVGPGNYVETAKGLETKLDGYGETLRDREVVERLLPIHSHCLYLQLAIDYGILGSLAFLYFLVRVALRLVRSVRSSAYALAGVGVLIAFGVNNLVDVTFPSLALEMGFLLGVALAGAKGTSKALERAR